jgi:hypothetical protein
VTGIVDAVEYSPAKDRGVSWRRRAKTAACFGQHALARKPAGHLIFPGGKALDSLRDADIVLEERWCRALATATDGEIPAAWFSQNKSRSTREEV